MRNVVATLVGLGSVLSVGLQGRSLAAAGDDRIVVQHFMFTPMSLTTHVGATVVWTNRDDEPHTVVSDAGLFRSGGIDSNESFSFRFDQPGTYHFTCSLHPQMVGTIVVNP